MNSGHTGRLGIVLMLAFLVVVLSSGSIMGIGTAPAEIEETPDAARRHLTAGFEEIQRFFAERDFSLLVAWKKMRESGDPGFFDRVYPEISREIDTWAGSLERRFGSASSGAVGFDYTFLLDRFAGRVLDPSAPGVVRDNALATICMICVMDALRCEAGRFHDLLRGVVERDPDVTRKAEALRWWRVTDGKVDEMLLERLLSSAAGAEPVLRGEIAKTLFALGTQRALQVQQLLVTPDSSSTGQDTGAREQIMCTAMRHLARAGSVEASPRMILALEDRSAEVRACAVESLERIAGMNFGFDPTSDRTANAAALSQWKAWWDGRGAMRAPSR